MKWLATLFKKNTLEGSQHDLQMLRLELQDQEKEIARLKADAERSRREFDARQKAGVQAEILDLLTDIAAPLSQLHTQKYLLEVEDRPIAARDVLSVFGMLTRGLENHGLKLDDVVGSQSNFDPNLHQPLSNTSVIRADQTVIIRFSGISFKGQTLRKAGVEAA